MQKDKKKELMIKRKTKELKKNQWTEKKEIKHSYICTNEKKLEWFIDDFITFY